MNNNYDDIINLPHHISKIRPKMPMESRAAQFSPFAALTGYDAAVKETARVTDKRAELDQSQKDAINARLQLIAEIIKEPTEVTITYFQPDIKKQGGAYLKATGAIKKLYEHERVVAMADGKKIPIDDIFGIEGKIFEILHDK